jgi:hypothetical protein
MGDAADKGLKGSQLKRQDVIAAEATSSRDSAPHEWESLNPLPSMPQVQVLQQPGTSQISQRPTFMLTRMPTAKASEAEFDSQINEVNDQEIE